MNPSFRESGAFDSFVSVAAFVLLDRFAGLPWAIAGATAWSLKATYTKHRKHQRIGWLLPTTTLYLIFRGTVGIITDSRAAYFGIGIGTKFAIGLGLIGSVVIGKGVAAMYADRVLPFPDAVRVHGIFRSTMNQLTVLAGLYEMGSAGSDIWLYNHSSKGGFVLIRILVNWVSGFVVMFGAILYADTRLKRIPGFGGLLELAEATLEHRGPAKPTTRFPAPDATSQGDR
ncbi:MAG: hypothetical protein E6G39_19020 [Actinobacteria bacterium]|jgi:hypothetical protein|nr:MAG: hypothetical protein E6G39_19020 [Actinomycetota bacterium]